MAKIYGTVIHSTDKARLVQVKNGGKMWIPESVITSSVLKPIGTLGHKEGHLVVEDWWAEKQDLT